MISDAVPEELCTPPCKTFSSKARDHRKAYLQQITDFRIMVNRCPDITDKFHNPLCLNISSKGFSSKYANSRSIFGFPLCGIHFFHFLITVYNSQDIQQLPLVFMNTFDLIKKFNRCIRDGAPKKMLWLQSLAQRLTET